MKRRVLLKPIFAAIDASVLAGTFMLSYWLRFHIAFLPERPVPDIGLYFRFSFVVAIVGLGLLYSSDMYRLRHLSFKFEDFFAILKAVTTSSIVIMATNFILRGYLTRVDFETYSRLIILFSWFLSIVFLTAWRISVSGLFRHLRKRGRGLKNVVIVGTDQVARGFHKAIRDNVEFEYSPIGFVSEREVSDEDQTNDLPLLGRLEDLPEILRKRQVSEVVLACLDTDRETVAQLVNICERADVSFSMIPGFFEILTRQMTVEEVADIPVFHLEERIFLRWGKVVKRGMDVALSLATLIALSPVLSVLAVLIRLESNGSVIYQHARVGKGEKVFYMLKIRSMYQETDRDPSLETSNSNNVLLKSGEDARVTKVGRLMRRLSLDEIPQVINILKGEMSWVGPRPHIPSEVANYQDWHKRRYDVLPGITGLTQVSGRKDLTLDEMVRLDTYYIENWSPLMDLQILLRTIPAVLSGRGAY